MSSRAEGAGGKASTIGRIRMYHTDKPTSLRFWHAFLKAYFGNDCRIDEIEEEIRPFVA